MPYIKKDTRELLDEPINQLVMLLKAESRENADNIWGMLNYIISVLVHRGVMGRFTEWHYHLMNNVMGVLGSVTSEFYRRVVVPYEEMKIIIAGDLDEFVPYREFEESS